MSLESLIMDGLNSLSARCAVSNFSAICGIASPARVSSALAGQRPFDPEDGLLYANVLRRMKALADSIAPIPVDWSETAVIKTILADISAGTLHISVVKDQPVMPPEQQYLVYLSGSDGNSWYFARRTMNAVGKRVIEGSFGEAGAARLTKEDGDQVVAALLASGHQAHLVLASTTMEDIGDFATVWG